MRIFLAALGHGHAPLIYPPAGFLHHGPAVLDDALLPLHLVHQGKVNGPEAVHVLDFGAGPEGIGAGGADAHVGVAAEVAVLHIRSGNAEILDHGMERGEVLAGLFGRTQVGLADNLHERHAGTVHVDQRVALGVVREVLHFGNVLFQMHTFHADGSPAVLQVGIALDLQMTVQGQWQVVLGDLVSLHQVRVRVVLPVKLGELRYMALESQAGHYGVFHRAPVDDGQGAGQTQAHRAGAGVGFGGLVIGGTPAEHLAASVQLDVYLKPDDGFVFHCGVLSVD